MIDADILADYGLDGASDVQVLKADRAWRLTHSTGEWVVARRPVYDPESRRVARFEAASRLLNKLCDDGQPWMRAKRNRHGQYVTQVENELIQVTSFVDGENGLDLADPAQIPAVARIMADNHRYQEISFSGGLENHDFVPMTTEGLEGRRQERTEFELDRIPDDDAMDRAIAEFARLQEPLNTLHSGLIHMDLSAGNIVWRNGAPAAIIDFEAFPAPFLLDVGFVALYWTMRLDPDTHDSTVDQEALETLLTSYAAHRPLSSAERAHLKDALIRCAIR